MIDSRETPHGSPGLSRALGVVSGFLFKLIRESMGSTQVQLAEQLGVDVASVQGWESGRRPLAAMRTRDLIELRFRFLQWGAEPTLLDKLGAAIEADLIITEVVQDSSKLTATSWHPVGVTVHRCELSELIAWPLTGVVPTSLRHLVTARVRRGPVGAQPILTEQQRTCLFDHLLMIADGNCRKDIPLARRQAVYLLGFDTRTSTVEWLQTEQLRALQNAARNDCTPSWMIVRSSAVALAYGGDRDPLRPYLQHALATDELEQVNLNYWAYWVGEIEGVQVDDSFMSRVDPRSWSGYQLLGHLLKLMHPGSGGAELNLHTVWALLLTHSALLSDYPHLRSMVASTMEEFSVDRDLSVRARRELFDITYATRLARR